MKWLKNLTTGQLVTFYEITRDTCVQQLKTSAEKDTLLSLLFKSFANQNIDLFGCILFIDRMLSCFLCTV